MIRLFAVGFAVLSLVPSVTAPAAEYKFKNIVDSTQPAPIGNFKTLGASISGSTVAFMAPYASQTRSGIFISDGHQITPVAKGGDPAPVGVFNFDSFTFAFGTTPAVSDNLAAFYGSYASGAGVFTGSGGALTPIAKTGDQAPSGVFQGFGRFPAISGTTVAFSANYTGGSGIFLSNGGGVTTVAQTSDVTPQGALTSFGAPAIGDNTVAFVGRYNGGSSVFSANAGQLTTITKTGDPSPIGDFSSLGGIDFDEVSTSDGTVAFLAASANRQGIFMGAGGALTTVAKSGDQTPFGQLRALFSGVSVSHGQVAFRGDFTNGAGIFIGNGGPLSKVIKTGDALLGNTLAGLDFQRFSLDPDGSGSLVFGYRLASGVTGVAVAIPVPEPGTGCLSGLLLAVLVARNRDGNRRSQDRNCKVK
jgi:hypothetical protein